MRLLMQVDRLPCFDLPWGIQFDDWPFALGAFATQQVRGIINMRDNDSWSPEL